MLHRLFTFASALSLMLCMTSVWLWISGSRLTFMSNDDHRLVISAGWLDYCSISWTPWINGMAACDALPQWTGNLVSCRTSYENATDRWCLKTWTVDIRLWLIACAAAILPSLWLARRWARRGKLGPAFPVVPARAGKTLSHKLV
jgi:hypothetical protein